MHIAYNALVPNNHQLPGPAAMTQQKHELAERYRAYQHVCNKYRHEIAAIQKYLPGWQPSPPTSWKGSI